MKKSEHFKVPQQIALIARGLAVVIGLALVAWSFSNDVRITGGPGFGFTQAAVLAAGLLNLLASTMRINLLLGIILCQLSLAATLVGAEFLLRATLSSRYYSPFRLDSRYLYTLVPGATRAYLNPPINGGDKIIYTVNSRGFRGEEFSIERTDAKRIVIYGDSFLQAEFTTLDETLAAQLETRLAAETNQPFEVINAGIAGYGPDQELRRIEDELSWLKPDLVIVAIFAGNDFGDLVRNKLYRLGPDGKLLENTWSYSDEIVLNEALNDSEFLIKRVARDARNSVRKLLKNEQYNSPMAEMEKALQQHLREYKEYVIDGDNVVRELNSDPYSADMTFLKDSPSAEYKRRMMYAVIERISSIVAAQGTPLLLIAIPHPMDVMGGKYEAAEVNLERYPDYQATLLTDTVQAIAEQNSLDFINLYPYFSTVSDPASLFRKGGDDHWNSKGQAYAAEITANYVLKSWFKDPEGVAPKQATSSE